MTEKTFMQGLELIQVVTQKAFTDGQTKAYHLLLKDIDDASFIQGIETLLKERVYTNIPSPAEIRDYCLGTREQDLDLRVSKAIGRIEKALLEVGTYKTVAFDDPIIHLIIRDFGGWSKVGKMDINDFKDKMKWDLPKLYKAYASRKNGEIPIMLKGIAQEEEVVYIGNKEKAQKWIGAYIDKHQISYERPNKIKELLEFIA